MGLQTKSYIIVELVSTDSVKTLCDAFSLMVLQKEDADYIFYNYEKMEESTD